MSCSYEIYLITNTVDEDWYVGATRKGAPARFKTHLRGQGGAPTLAAKIQKLGTKVFQQIVLEVGVGDVHEAERRWYDFCVATRSGKPLQIIPGQYPIHTPELNAKISQALTGHKVNNETRSRMSESAKKRHDLWFECFECGWVGNKGESQDHERETCHTWIGRTLNPQYAWNEADCYDCEFTGSPEEMNSHVAWSGHRICPVPLPPPPLSIPPHSHLRCGIPI